MISAHSRARQTKETGTLPDLCVWVASSIKRQGGVIASRSVGYLTVYCRLA